ncbi:MAG: hypothetical protein HY901_14130, partial [Deltaproteobacteria bacterium]|nr:hypothetical protein [Deltaproteobacteria bacterium]
MITKRRLAALAVVVLSLTGCSKKKDGDAQSGAQAGGGTQTAVTQTGPQPGGKQPGSADPGAKTPEGCNSDLSQPIEADYTLTEKCSPYKIGSDFGIDGYTLTIEPGVELRFADNTRLGAGYSKPGRLVVKGTKEKPVRMIGARSAAGSWAGVKLWTDAGGSSLDNLVIENAGTDDLAALTLDTSDASLTGVVIKGAKKRALELNSPKPLKAIAGLDLKEAGGDPDELVRMTVQAAHSLGAGNAFPEKAIILLHGQANQDIKLTAQGVPYRIFEEMQVDPPEGKSAVLTIEAGVTLQFSDDAALTFGYTQTGAGLKVLGTAEKPVTFTRYGEDQKSTPFRGLSFWGGSRAPELAFAVIEFAGHEDQGAITYRDAKGLGKITHCTFRHLPGPGIVATSAKERFQAFD